MDYNEYMSKTTKQIKEENPNLTHQQAFVLAANSWSSGKKKAEKQAIKEQRGGRAPTEYNKFMSKELANQRKLHPDAEQTEIFRHAVDSWNSQ